VDEVFAMLLSPWMLTSVVRDWEYFWESKTTTRIQITIIFLMFLALFLIISYLEATIMKSNIFQLSLKYVPFSKTNPIAMLFNTNSLMYIEENASSVLSMRLFLHFVEALASNRYLKSYNARITVFTKIVRTINASKYLKKKGINANLLGK